MSKTQKKSKIAKSCVPLPLKQNELSDVVEKAKDWALMNGAAMRLRSQFDSDSLYFAPFILLPSPFPKSEFEKAVAIQPILNELMHKVAHDYDFLRESLKDTIKVDEFTRNLFEIFETVQKEGMAQVSQFNGGGLEIMIFI